MQLIVLLYIIWRENAIFILFFEGEGMPSKKYKNLFPFHLTKPASCGIISSVSERTSHETNAEVAELADAHV